MYMMMLTIVLVLFSAVQSKNACNLWVLVNFTENPVVHPAEEDGVIDAIVGDEVVIKFYAAGLPEPRPDHITWFFNGFSNIDWGNFSSDKKSLTIPNVQLPHAGEYKFRVFYHLFGGTSISALAVTTVNVIGEEGLF